MFELLALGIAGAGALFGHVKARRFVGRRLRYSDLVDKPGLGLWTGLATTLAAAPVVALLPFVGAGTAIALGAGVGTGVALGVRDAHGPPLLED